VVVEGREKKVRRKLEKKRFEYVTFGKIGYTIYLISLSRRCTLIVFGLIKIKISKLSNFHNIIIKIYMLVKNKLR